MITCLSLEQCAAAADQGRRPFGLLPGCRNRRNEVSDPVVVDDRAANNVLAEDTGYSEADLALEEKGVWQVTVGTVLRPSSGTWIPALAPAATALPVVKAAALSATSGELADVVTSLVTGNEPNMAIYDARCSDEVYAWVEMDMLRRT